MDCLHCYSILINSLLSTWWLTCLDNCWCACKVWTRRQHSFPNVVSGWRRHVAYQLVSYWYGWLSMPRLDSNNHSSARSLHASAAVLDFDHWYRSEWPELSCALDALSVVSATVASSCPQSCVGVVFFHSESWRDSALNRTTWFTFWNLRGICISTLGQCKDGQPRYTTVLYASSLKSFCLSDYDHGSSYWPWLALACRSRGAALTWILTDLALSWLREFSFTTIACCLDARGSSWFLLSSCDSLKVLIVD